LRKNRWRLPSVVYRLGHYAVNGMGVNFPRDSRSMQPGKTPIFNKSLTGSNPTTFSFNYTFHLDKWEFRVIKV
jgi:hypothetical protein